MVIILRYYVKLAAMRFNDNLSNSQNDNVDNLFVKELQTIFKLSDQSSMIIMML